MKFTQIDVAFSLELKGHNLHLLMSICINEYIIDLVGKLSFSLKFSP